MSAPATNSISVYFRARIQFLLSERGISQRQLALATGISQQSVNNYVRGVTQLPGAEELLALARYFAVPMESLLCDGATGATDVAPPLSPTVPVATVRRAVGRMRRMSKELTAEADRLEGQDEGSGQE